MMEQPELIHILAQTGLFTDGAVYLILKVGLAQGECIPAGLEAWPASFWACIRDKDEVTLVLAQESGQALFEPRTLDRGRRVCLKRALPDEEPEKGLDGGQLPRG